MYIYILYIHIYINMYIYIYIYKIYKYIYNYICINIYDCNWIRTHNHLVHKRTLNHLAKLATHNIQS